MRAWLFAFTLLLSPVAASMGADADPSVQRLYTALLQPAYQPFPAEVRREVAEAALGYLEFLNRKIPRVTPDEAAWVQGEWNSGDSRRVAAAMLSKEGTLRDLGNKLDLCLSILPKLVASVGASDEMFWWLRSSDCFDSPDTWFAKLQRAQVAGNDDFFLFGLGVMQSLHQEIPWRIADGARGQ